MKLISSFTLHRLQCSKSYYQRLVLHMGSGTDYVIDHIWRGTLPESSQLFSAKGTIIVRKAILPVTKNETRKRLKEYFMERVVSYDEINECLDTYRLCRPLDFLAKLDDLEPRYTTLLNHLREFLDGDLGRPSVSDRELLTELISTIHRKV